MRKRGFTAVELVLVIVVLAIVVSVTLVQVDRRRQARLREESAAGLKGLYESFMMNGSGFPALSSEPGQLYPAAEYVDRHGGSMPRLHVASGRHRRPKADCASSSHTKHELGFRASLALWCGPNSNRSGGRVASSLGVKKGRVSPFR